MAVYVDALTAAPLSRKWRWPRACHLVADTDDELHAFAASIGLKRQWHQTSNRGISHYDLNESRRRQAVTSGAIELTRQEFASRFLRGQRQS